MDKLVPITKLPLRQDDIVLVEDGREGGNVRSTGLAIVTLAYHGEDDPERWGANPPSPKYEAVWLNAISGRVGTQERKGTAKLPEPFDLRGPDIVRVSRVDVTEGESIYRREVQ